MSVLMSACLEDLKKPGFKNALQLCYHAVGDISRINFFLGLKGSALQTSKMRDVQSYKV